MTDETTTTTTTPRTSSSAGSFFIILGFLGAIVSAILAVQTWSDLGDYELADGQKFVAVAQTGLIPLMISLLVAAVGTVVGRLDLMLDRTHDRS